MPRLTPSLALLVTLSACAPGEYPGSQIGTEDSFTCVLVSSEDLVDLTATPEGFSASPQAALDAAVGTYAGAPLDENQQPTSGAVSLEVSAVGGTPILQRFEPEFTSEEDGGANIDSVALCPPRFLTNLHFLLVADGLPELEATLETSFTDQAWAETNDPGAFDDDLPTPVTFNPSEFGEVESWAVFSGGVQGDWWVYVDWRAWNPSEAAPDGDVPVTTELLLTSRLSRL